MGIRHLQAFLLFLGMTIGYSMRVNMFVAIVAMANSSTANPDFEDYGWDADEKATILSSFFWGYTVMQLPSGYLANVWSGQKLLASGVLICGVFNLLMQAAAHYGDVIAVCACRVGMGLSQSCLLPCIHTLLSKWVPPNERARLGTFAYAGAQFGTVFALPVSGWVAASSLGWPFVFYIFGGLAIIWSILFFIFGADSPSEHRSISIEEKSYIVQSLMIDQEIQEISTEKLKVPWKSILTSVPMWAIIITHCGQNWGYWMLLTGMPNFMNAILGYNIQKNGTMSALPYLVMWILSFPLSWLADFALRKGISRSIVRKICNTMAFWGPAVALLVLGLEPGVKDTIAVAILVVAVALNAGALCGFQINHIDLSPNFSGTMMSITNCLASIVAVAEPLLVSKIITKETDASQWSTVFFLSAGIYFTANLVFLIFGQAVVQSWNDPKVKNHRTNEKM
ncbi:putative inorganic phosphate cotransporter isoform X2 [Prorops nasuta]